MVILELGVINHKGASDKIILERRSNMGKRTLREFFLLSVLFVFICITLSNSWAAVKYPSHYIELYYGFPGGSSIDVQNRLLARFLEKYLGVPVVSVSKPGGGGVVATNALINSRPDGYTIANLTYYIIVDTILLSKGGLTLEDVRIAGQWNVYGTLLCVPLDSQWQSFQELIDFARKNQGVKYAVPGIANSSTIRMKNLNIGANLKMIEVPFKGGAEVVTAVLGKHVPVGIFSVMTGKANADGGKMRILFSFDPPSKFRLDPNIPCLATAFDKSVSDKDIPIIGFLVVPRKTPDETVNVIEKALEKVCKDPEFISEMEKIDTLVEFYDSKTATQNLHRLMERIKVILQK